MPRPNVKKTVKKTLKQTLPKNALPNRAAPKPLGRRPGRPRKSDARTRDVRVFEQLARAEGTLETIGEALGLSYTELADWASDPRRLARVHHLARLADAQTQILISRFRTSAAIHLANLAARPEGGEPARKACVDLLNLELREFLRDKPRATSHTNQPPNVSQEAILEALEALGSEDDQR